MAKRVFVFVVVWLTLGLSLFIQNVLAGMIKASFSEIVLSISSTDDLSEIFSLPETAMSEKGALADDFSTLEKESISVPSDRVPLKERNEDKRGNTNNKCDGKVCYEISDNDMRRDFEDLGGLDDHRSQINDCVPGVALTSARVINMGGKVLRKPKEGSKTTVTLKVEGAHLVNECNGGLAGLTADAIFYVGRTKFKFTIFGFNDGRKESLKLGNDTQEIPLEAFGMEDSDLGRASIWGVDSIEASTLATIPEPNIFLLLGTGLVGLLGYGWRRRRQAALILR